MARITHAERVELADHVYLKGRTKIEAPPGWVIAGKEENPKSGLEIYALRKESTDEVVFTVRGSDADGKDFAIGGPNLSHIVGKLHEQDKEALAFVDNFRKENKNPDGSDKYHYTVAGDSKGGGIGQIIAHTFGWGGTATDPAAGGGVVKDPAYLDFVRNNLTTVSEPLGVPKGKFLNIREEGSPVPNGSGIFPGVGHLGETITFNFVVANKLDALLSPFATLEGQHTDRSARIAAFNNARPSGEADPIFVLFNDKISKITSEIQKLEEKLFVLNSYQNKELEDIKEIESIERYLHSLQNEKNEDQATRENVITGEYGDANGFVDQWAKSYLENLTSTKNPWLADNGSDSLVTKNLPQTREELLAQLEELGVTPDEAEGIADRSEVVSQDNNPSENSPTLLGLDPELWKAMSNIAEAAQKVEQVGDDITALIHAFQQGNDWDAFESTVNLFTSLDTVAGLSESYTALTGDVSSKVQGMSSLVNAIGDLTRLQRALQDGDEWAIASSATSMVDNGMEAYHHFRPGDNQSPGAIGATYSGAAASIVGLGMSIKQMADAFDDGDAIAKMQAALNVVQSSLSTYVAVSTAVSAMTTGTAVATGAAQAVGDALPAIGCAIGIAQGLLAIADGDIQGGTEQIGLAIATTVLMACGPYGWIGALVLQIGNATRNCDGQIIDTENIEEFTDNIAPAGDEAAHAAIVSIEKPAEWGNDVYEDNIYYSGYDVNMLAEIGVDIPEDLKPQFGFFQMNAEFFNPLRYTQYFEDLDEMSLSDIWDSLYISQAVVATIALFHKEEPPRASVLFTQNEDGQLAFAVGGDKSMRPAAESYGSAAQKVMEYYQQTGGRLLIDCSLPSLTLVRGSGSTINYRSETGGQVSVMLDDMSQVLQELSAALYARDRGDRLDSAVDISRDALGEIDFAKVDRIMAGYGFKKDGMTYTYGETKKLTGTSYGSGVFVGGGNVGSQGQHFVAKDSDIKSLPLRDDQRPSQTMGEIARIVGLNNAFAGAGAELLAMAMVSGGLLGLAAPAGARVTKAEVEDETVRPLAPEELVRYLHNLQAYGQEAQDKSAPPSRPQATPALAGRAAGQLQQFLTEHWGELALHPEWFSGMPESAYFYRQAIGYHDLLSDGSRPGWYGPTPREDDPLLRQRAAARGQSAEAAGEEVGEEAAGGHTSGQSFTGHRIYPDTHEVAGGGAAPADPPPPSGPVFVMAEDSSLRFLLAELLEDTAPGSYGKSEDALTLVAFGQAAGGQISREANGDIRFTPTPGFAGTASFSYTVRNAAGDLIVKVATIQVENVNDPPLLLDDRVTLGEGEPFYLDTLLVNDTDPEGDTLTLDHLRGISHGEIALQNGRLAFIPEAGYHGEVTFSYWVYDQAFAYPTMALATLTYLDLDTAPAAGDDRFLTLEDASLAIAVEKLLANDVEHDGENITFSGLAGAAHGTVREQPDGTILFAPDQDYAGTEAGFSYLVTDDSGKEATAWVVVEVLDAREAPVVSSTSRAPILEDEVLTFTPEEVARFVHDADGDQLHLDFITNVTGGTIVAAGGYYSFVPDADYSGPAAFDYRANDNHRGVVDGHLSFDILPVNDPIATGEDFLITPEDQPVTVQVEQLLSNDLDPDGTTIDFTGLGGSTHGSASLNPDGTVSFTPETDYAGNDAGFEYLVQDDAGLESTGWVRVRVDNLNDAPAIIAEGLEIPEDRPLAFDAATLARLVRDADDDTLQVTGVSAVSGGTISEKDSLYTFTPDPNFHGSATLTLAVADQQGETVSVPVSLGILSVDDPAVLGDDLLVTVEEEPVATTVSALLANDHDDDGSLTFARLGDAFHGTVELSPENEILFTPDQDYFGSEAGFTYVVSDPDGYEATGRVKIDIVGVNDAPEITAESLTAYEDQPITFTAATLSRLIADSDGDPLALTAVTDVTGGTVTESGGVFTFTPTANYHGPASLNYQAHDGHGGQVAGTLRLDLLAVDDPTVFGDHAFVTDEERPLEVTIADLLAGDADPDGPLTFIGPGAVAHGQVRLAGQTLQFLPDQDYFGNQAGFSYQVEDAEGNRATDWVKVAVEGVNDEPEILADRLHLQEDQAITFDQAEIAKFLYDADGDPLRLDQLTNITGGRLEQQGGVFSFIPDADFYGEAGFDYLASNGAGETLAGTLAIAVSPVNDLPETTYFSAAGIEDREVTMTVAELMAGASDVEDGTNLRFAGIDSSLHGAVYVDSDQIVHFLPDKDFFGSGFFRYTVMDSEGGIGLGLVGIDIAGENDAPVAADDAQIVAWSNNLYENVYLADAFLANDADVDGDPLQILAAGPAEHGTVSVDAQGNIHYIAPADDWVGVDCFSYEISDGHGAMATATAQIDVKINTSPDVYSELLFTREDIISLIGQGELLANDSDIDGDSMRITAVDQAEHCSVALEQDGRIRFTPEPNFNNNYPGQASFRYTVSDGISEPVTGVAFFDIEPVNDAPILTGERIEGAVEDNSFSFTVAQLLANDTDVEMASPYEEDAIHFAGVSQAGHGQLSWDSGTIYYVPDANFCGVETFTYAVVDSFGAESTVASEIYVQPVNDYPVAQEDIGSTAEDSIWNYYSIAGLVGNDFDVDGDSLTIINPYVISGNADVALSGGNLKVKPAWHENRVVIGYTVSDGHGGEVASKLTIPQIREHNFAPTFSGIYRVEWENSNTVWFNFHAEDRNGGNTWSNDSGDIVAISGAAPNGGQLWDHGYSFRFRGDIVNATVALTAVDQGGATGSIFVRIGNLSKADGNYIYSPVVLDLDGDGVELLDLSAGVAFDWNRDGRPEATGWVGGDDGFLVYDYDRDRVVRYANELALREYDPQANTDLEGLRAFDTDNDGRFTSEDAEFKSFGVWQDKNSDGLSDEGEFQSLCELQISAINLQSDEDFQEQSGNIVYGTTTYEKEDGTSHQLADVGLLGESLELEEVEVPGMSVGEENALTAPLVDISLEQPESVEEISESTAGITAAPTSPETSQLLDEPEEVAGQGGETVTLAANGPEEASPSTEEVQTVDDDSAFPDEAEITRQCLQLISDMAVAGDWQQDDPPLSDISTDIADYPLDPPLALEHDALAIV